MDANASTSSNFSPNRELKNDLFFGSFLPPFVDPAGDAFAQTLLLGAIFMAVGVVGDGFYAVVAGRAGKLLKRERVRMVVLLRNSDV